MGEILKDLCRLCAKQHEISKDLLDANNKHVLDLIRQFTQISVTECDNMPTKVCLDCEERMVSFQLFILECYKVQDTLRKLCLDTNIKTENSILELGLTVIKSEEGHLQVKDEILADELLNNALQNHAMEDCYDGDNFQEASSEEDDLDNITIASLKQLKTKTVHKKETNGTSHKISKRINSRIKNFIKLECSICEMGCPSWPELRVHYLTIHQTKPVAYCSCGFAIQSKSVLYKHIQEHKADSRRMKREVSEGSDGDSSFKVSDFVRFKCENCDKECTSWYTLRAHCDRHHNQPPLVTCKCGVTLKSKSVMYKHVQDHKNPSHLRCDKCSKILKSTEALEKHRLRHVPKTDRKFKCEACDKVFNNKELLRSHERSHIPIEERKVFTCDVCHLKFTTRSSCASHRRVVHEKVKAYVCDLCGYACGTNGELRQHRAIHSDDKPFVCNKCNKPFKTYSNLKTHMDTHEDTSYVCYVCSRVLNSRRTLRKHLLVHEDKCRHVCSYCNKAFKRRQTLKSRAEQTLNKHQLVHEDKCRHVCSYCNKAFKRRQTLKVRLYLQSCVEQSLDVTETSAGPRRQVSPRLLLLQQGVQATTDSEVDGLYGNIYWSTKTSVATSVPTATRRSSDDRLSRYDYICSRSEQALNKHLLVHEDKCRHVCSYCNKAFKRRQTLKSLIKHLLVHEDKCRHVCSYCNKAFKRRQTLKVHMYTHTGDKPLSCKWCDERFSYASTLRSHRLRAHPDKMAQHVASQYNHAPITFTHVTQLQQQQEEYIKRDLAAIGIGQTKNENDTAQ
ncbi:zinc-finger associated domain (zf-AD) domain-containing protein [Phthorimaea operculella]|nr:zinc-finger associated domain (zf-AD) domain-containing protein [Phthorimaea operculella]